jgi:transcriptional regulator with XRE-family HTH domain
MTSQNSPFDLAPAQAKAARALLGWNQQQLAQKANVAPSTVADFERGKRSPVANNLEAMREAFENAGVSLLPGGAVVGPRSTFQGTLISAQGNPIRLIDATDLSQWADRLDAKALFPELLLRLILVSTGNSTKQLLFPSGDSIQQEGWDGICEQDTNSSLQWLPTGTSGWELSTRRDGLRGKADDDYGKRSADARGLDQKRTTFVFATLKHWRQGAKWAQARRGESVWADVRIIDADDLVQWIELFPSVGYWLATHLGKVFPGTMPLADVWKEWRLSTKWPMTPDLLLAGRDDEAIDLLKWMYGEPAIRSVQADSPDEAAAFLYAAIDLLPESYRTLYHTRCLCVFTADAARALGNSPSRLVVVVEASDPGLAARLVQQGHHVFVTYGSAVGASEMANVLPRAPHEAFQAALENMGVPEGPAATLSRDSARSLAILRRLIPSGAAARVPEWASDSKGRLLLPALLSGAWDSARDGDRWAIEQLSGESFDTFDSRCSQWAGFPDAPLRHAGTTWKIASPRDAWFRLAGLISRSDLESFVSVAQSVLGAPDPRFEVNPEERWLAGIRGKLPKYSSWLLSGFTEALLLLSMYGERIHAVPDARQFADKVVSGLLTDADESRWWSMSSQLRTLAEAAPETFIDAVEASLIREDQPIMALFKEDGGPMGAAHHSDLLWALETLAWSPQYLSRASQILARLAVLDPGGRYANRPKNSLRSIFLLWKPQTNATLAERLRILDRVRRIEPDAAWSLMRSILPGGYDTMLPTPQPRWRDFSIEKPEEVTHRLIFDGAVALSERLVEDAGTDPQRWVELIEHIPNLAPEWRRETLVRLSAIAESSADDSSRLPVWAALRKLLSQHRSVPDARWALPSQELDQIEAVYHQFEPLDIVSQRTWLFSDRAQIVSAHRVEDWKQREDELLAMRRVAVSELLSSSGFASIRRLANEAKNPFHVGFAFGQDAGDSKDADNVLAQTLGEEAPAIRAFVQGLIVALLNRSGSTWSRAFLSQAQQEKWDHSKVLQVLLALPSEKQTWDIAASFGNSVRLQYWRSANAYWSRDSEDEAVYGINQLLEAGRARAAVHLVAGSRQNLPARLIVRMLTDAAKEPWSNTGDGNEATMFQWSVVQLLDRLTSDDDVSEAEVGQLEWDYLALLEHSERSPVVLHRSMSRNPSFFVQVLSAIYRPGSESAPDRDQISKEVKDLASHSFRLLQSWNIVPGATDTGIDAPMLSSWIKDAHQLAVRAERGAVGDQHIGQVLSFSKVGLDGVWPDIAVRDVIDAMRNVHIENGILTGVHNNRGFTCRGLLDGGAPERNLALTYRKWANEVKLEWPRTSSLLERIARSFEEDARYHDEDAERTDWTY